MSELLTVESTNNNDKASIRECNPLVRTLVACIASCSHVPEAQSCLVNELKSSLQKAVVMPESRTKHENIQALCSLINTAIDACPPPSSGSACGNRPVFVDQKQGGGMSNIVKLLVKKNLVVDLARVVHSLDLSGRYLVPTINQALRPLELLTRLVNQPQSTSASSKKPKSRRSNTELASAAEEHQSPPQEGDSSRLDVEPTAEEEGPDTTLAVDPTDGTVMNVSDTNEAAEGLEELIEDILQDVVGDEQEGNEIIGDVIISASSTPRHHNDDDDDDNDDEMEEDAHEGTLEGNNDNVHENDGETGADSFMIGEEEHHSDEDDVDDEDSDDEEEENAHDEEDEDEEIEDDNEDEGSDMEAGQEEDEEDALEEVHVEEFNIRDIDSIVGMRNFPVIISPDDNANEVLSNSNTSVQPSHPLLSRQTSTAIDQRTSNRSTGISSSAANAMNRQIRARRYRVLTHNSGTNAIHVHYSPDHPPAVLQRLLGADIMHIADVIGSSGRGGSLLTALAPHAIRLQRSPPDDMNNDEIDIPGIGSLAGIPSSLTRWRETSQILDSNSLFTLIQIKSQAVCRELERERDSRLANRRDKRLKLKMSNEAIEKKKESEANTSVINIGDRSIEDSIGEDDEENVIEVDPIRSGAAESLEMSLSSRIVDQPLPIETTQNMALEQIDTAREVPEESGDEVVINSTSNREEAEEEVDVERIDGGVTGSSWSEQHPTTAAVEISTENRAQTSTIVTSASTAASTESATNIPEGIDPSFLEALPSDIRQEVINNQLQMQRIQRRAEETGMDLNSSVNAEFLAALPPNIQEEILAHQRAQQATAVPPDDIDANTVLNTLTPAVRQQVLADMDDSYLVQLPEDIRNEAASYRRNYEQQQRRLFGERLFDHSHSLTTFLRHANVTARRIASSRSPYLPSSFRRNRHLTGHSSRNPPYNSDDPSGSAFHEKNRGKHLLDAEPLSCLLILLFINENSLNCAKLQKILKNLSYHAPTRKWIVSALLSILRKASKSNESIGSKANWLSLSLDAALGCRANVFEICRQTGKKQPSISIHPQAASAVCRKVLETLTSLAKFFPNQFLPESNHKQTSSQPNKLLDIWECLLKLDSGAAKGKGKHVQRTTTPDSNTLTDFENTSLCDSGFSKIMEMLSTPIFKRSQSLTDKLLHLLSTISNAIPGLKEERELKTDEPASVEPDTASSSTQKKDEELDKEASIPSQLALLIDVNLLENLLL